MTKLDDVAAEYADVSKWFEGLRAERKKVREDLKLIDVQISDAKEILKISRRRLGSAARGGNPDVWGIIEWGGEDKS